MSFYHLLVPFMDGKGEAQKGACILAVSLSIWVGMT